MNGETTLMVPVDHPAFAGHFPGDPVLPGVVLLDEAIHAVEMAVGVPLSGFQIASAKFQSRVKPGEILSIKYEILPSASVRFDIFAGARGVATGSLILAECAQP